MATPEEHGRGGVCHDPPLKLHTRLADSLSRMPQCYVALETPVSLPTLCGGGGAGAEIYSRSALF